VRQVAALGDEAVEIGVVEREESKERGIVTDGDIQQTNPPAG